MVNRQDSYEVIWPRGRKTVTETTVAPRLKSLEGKIIAELWNGAFRGDEIFPVVEQELTKKYPGIKFVNYKTIGLIHGTREAEVIASLPEALKKNGCVAAITTTGC